MNFYFIHAASLEKYHVTFLKSGHGVTVSINAVAMNLEGQRKKRGNKDRLSSLNCTGEKLSKCNVSSMHAVDIYYYLTRRPSTSDWIFVGTS